MSYSGLVRIDPECIQFDRLSNSCVPAGLLLDYAPFGSNPAGPLLKRTICGSKPANVASGIAGAEEKEYSFFRSKLPGG